MGQPLRSPPVSLLWIKSKLNVSVPFPHPERAVSKLLAGPHTLRSYVSLETLFPLQFFLQTALEKQEARKPARDCDAGRDLPGERLFILPLLP